MKEKVYELIDSYREQYVEMLQRWVRVPSVKDAAEEGAPFGREVREMLSELASLKLYEEALGARLRELAEKRGT